MRHTINYILSLLALSLVFVSCARETGLKMDEGAGNTVRFTIESSLRAVGDENTTRPTPALQREKAIDKLYAVVYKTSSGLHYKTIECTALATAGQYEFDNEASGEYYFFLIANPDTDLVAKLMAGPSTPEDLGMLVATQTAGEDKQATNFLMTSDRKNVTISSKASTDAGTIKLARVAARFDIYNTIDGLEITKVTFGKRRVQSHLFAQVGKMDGLTATENAKVYEGNLFESNTLKATIYGYETDVRNETFFTIEASYKGKPLKPETVRLENFVIKRNHLYNIILHDVGGSHDPSDPTKKFGEFEYTIKVADWNGGEELNYSEDDILKPLYVDYAATLSNAPYMTPYLVNSPEEIYTTTKEASEVTITVGGYMEPGTLELAPDFANTMNATLTDLGNPTTDPQTGKISHSYKLTIPAMADFVPLVKDGKPAKPEFQEIPLVAKNYSGVTVKHFTVKHGRIKMPLEYVSEHYLAPHTEGQPFTFATDETDINNVGYFYVMGFIKAHKQFTVEGKGYHLPHDMYELASITPYSNSTTSGFTKYSVGEDAGPVENRKEWVTMPCWAYLIGGKSGVIDLYSDYRTDKAKSVSYGLRFKNDSFGNTLVTAYRYHWVGDFTAKAMTPPIPAITSYYEITTRYLGANWNGGVDGIANEEFWTSNTESDATRRFYAVGRIDDMDGNSHREVGASTNIISSVCTDVDTNKPTTDDQVVSRVVATQMTNKTVMCNSRWLANRIKDNYYKHIRFPVRPFSDK